MLLGVMSAVILFAILTSWLTTYEQELFYAAVAPLFWRSGGPRPPRPPIRDRLRPCCSESLSYGTAASDRVA